MANLIKRRNYLVHPSSQFKYIAMTILPALIMTVTCAYFLLHSGEVFLAKQQCRIASEIASIDETISLLKTEVSFASAEEKVDVLKKRLIILRKNLEIEYANTVNKWALAKMVIFLSLTMVLLFSGIISLLFSHAIAGPLFRLRRSIDMLAQGKDIEPLNFRHSDEFRELASSFEKLRIFLKSKGILK